MNGIISDIRQRFPPRLAGTLAWLLAVLWLTGCATPEQAFSGPEATAETIRSHYETALSDLPQSKQRHYAQRLYRITGDVRYLPLNRDYADRLNARLNKEFIALETLGHAERRSQKIVANYSTSSEKKRRRKQMLGQWGEIPYAKKLAFELVQAKAYGLLNERDLPGYRRAINYLKSMDFGPFLLDPGVMSIYAAQVANLTYYLYDLGVADLREGVMAAFRQQYPPERDAALSRTEYRNKLYGMTHFVIAASRYYQQPVDSATFDWVLKEFAAGLEPIVERSKEDIYTEVGISFQLAGKTQHPAVGRLQSALLQAYNPAARMIPAEDGSKDLAHGEHRNVLAIMLLDWPERLYPGPVLSEHAPAATRFTSSP